MGALPARHGGGLLGVVTAVLGLGTAGRLRRCVRRFGGTTGGVLGALAETAALVALAAG